MSGVGKVVLYPAHHIVALLLERIMVNGNAFRFLSIFLLLFSITSNAEERPYYMWVDDDGVLNFDQNRPRDRESEEIVESPLEFGQRRFSDEPTETVYISPEEKFAQQIREVNCTSDRKILEKLLGFKAILFRGEDGLFRQLSEEAKQEKISETEQAIKENCSEPDS